MEGRKRIKKLPKDTGRLDPDKDVDKGWAWLVLCADCFVAIMSAMPYSSGIFNIIFLEVFGMSKQVTAWLTAVHCSLLHLTGPLSSYLDRRISPRWTLVLGGLIGALGYLLTFFATNFIFVFITYGLIAGVGLGLTYVPCISIVSIYFNKYRNHAYGVTMTAMAVGTVVLPSFITQCTEYFGWRGCMLIIAGLQLQMLVCGALAKSHRLPVENLETAVDESSTDDDDVESKETDSDTKDNLYNDEEEYVNSIDSKLLANGNIASVSTQHGFVKSNINIYQLDEETGSVVLHQSLVDIRQPISSIEIFEPTNQKHALHKNPGFLLLTIIMFLLFVSCMIVYVHFPAFFVTRGTSKSTVSLQLTILGVGNIFSRIIGGLATTGRDVDPFLAFLASIGISSILMLFCPLLSLTFVGQMIFVIVFGMYSPWYFSMLPPVTIQMVGARRLPAAWGVENMVGGVGVLLGPPLAGWLFDVTGTYVYSMYIAGGIYVLAVILGLLIPVASSRHHNATSESVR